MKTKKNNSLRVAASVGLLVTLLAVVCCKTKDGSQSDNSPSGTQTETNPPKIDIHTAVLTNNQEALQQHIDAGSNLNEKDPFGGSSPLITASLFDKKDIAKMLIDAGADVNFQNNDGSTALHVAAFFCRPEIVKMLLDKGADKTIKNKFGSTAYESVTPPFAEAKNAYDMMGKMLAPMGLKLDYVYLEKTRPVIAAMLK